MKKFSVILLIIVGVLVEIGLFFGLFNSDYFYKSATILMMLIFGGFWILIIIKEISNNGSD